MSEVANGILGFNHLNILGKRYEVLIVPGLHDGHGKDIYGECDDHAQQIRLAPGMPYGLAQDTMIHEPLHALDFHLNLGLGERRVQVLAVGLLALFKANPEWAKMVTDPGDGESKTKPTV